MVAVATYGHGPTNVLVLPAWFCSADSWSGTVGWLDPDIYTVALGDYPGHGRRKDESAGTSIKDLAEDMRAVVDTLGWNDYHVVGHSMGGKVAQLLQAIDRDRVRSVVGVVPVMPGPLTLDADTRSMMTAATQDQALRAQIVAWSTGNRYSDFIAEKIARESFEQTTEEAFGAHFRAWADDDITAEVTGNTGRITILIGEHDNSITRDAMEQALLPHHPNARIEVLVSTGHYPIFETPLALASTIDRFLRTD